MQPPATLRVFWLNAPEDIARALTMISAAVSLTNDIAYKLVHLSQPSSFGTEEIVGCLRASNFIIKPNGEWYIEAAIRRFLLDQLSLKQDMEKLAHETLLDEALRAVHHLAERPVPKYLHLKVGEAYHVTALRPEEGLLLYREAYKDEYTGEQWLLGELAYEQYQRKVLPQHIIEPFFFRGMTAYRERRWQDAERNFLRVADDGAVRDEVAVASHLLGLILQRQRHLYQKAKDYMEQGLRIEEALGKQHGRAVVMHSLANLIGDREPVRARNLLEESSEILKKRDPHGYAEVQHSLGKHIMKADPRRAEELLRTSLNLLVKLNDLHGQAQVLHTLGKMLRRSKPSQAVDYLRRSLALRRQLGIWREQAQVMQSIAEIMGKEAPEYARKLLLEALEIEKEFNNKHGEAQVLNALGMNLRGHDWKEARARFENVLSLSNHPKDLAVAHLGLSHVAEEHDHDLPSAHSHMQKAIHYQGLTNRSDLVRSHQKRLRDIERRMQAGL
ncbi:MAG TPA: hypothetical protein VF553_19295 [Pyrinomonadaceae bacterium]